MSDENFESPKLLQRIDIFISSPSDVLPEREILLRVIEKLNRLSYIRAKYVLNPLAYEREVPPASGDNAQMIVGRYMTEPDDCYLLICVMWSRMGTPFRHSSTNEAFESGTEYEFITAYRANEQHGRPHILIYRKLEDAPDAQPEQQAKVKVFFKQFEGADAKFKGLYKTYSTLAEFEDIIFEHIDTILSKHPPESALQKTFPAPQRPKIHEEARRLDAAMPSQTAVGQPTEIWVQLCISGSDGFRSKLPSYTMFGQEIARDDVRESNLAVAFPIDPSTDLPRPVELQIEVNAPDFTVSQAIQWIMLSAKSDSGQLTFSLVPSESRQRAIVHIIVKQRTTENTVVTLGSTAIYTQVIPASVQLFTQIVWNIISLPLASLSILYSPRRSEEQRTSSETSTTGRVLESVRSVGTLPAYSSHEDLIQWDIFLGYSGSDRAIMLQIRQDLRNAGLSAWTYENLNPFPLWRQGIEGAIKRSKCMVVILSPDAKLSSRVQSEIDYALQESVPIVPLLVRGDEENAIPLTLISTEIDLRSNFEQGFQLALSIIKKIIN